MKGKQSGFTLIEMLISITLLTLVLATGSMVYLQLATRWDKELGSFSQDIGLTKAVWQLDSVFNGIVPFVVRDKANKPTFLFVGGKESVFAVTHSGLLTGSPEVFRLTVRETQDQQFQLIYQATPINSVVLVSTEQNIEFERTVVLLTTDIKPTFDYFGWESLTQKALNIPGVRPSWFEHYSALVRELPPEQIRLTIYQQQKPLQLNFELDKDASGLRRLFDETFNG